MTYAIVVSILAVIEAGLLVLFFTREVHHHSLLADIGNQLARARTLVGSDAKAARAAIDNVLASLKAKLP
jgi:hypothetical protein